MAMLGMVPLAHGETPAAGAALPSGGAAAPTTKTAVGTPAQAASSTEAIRRDPKGRAGISPGMEAIARGDAALVAGDHTAANAAYQEAIKVEPQLGLGQVRLAALYLALGELERAAVVLTSAERAAAGDARLTLETLALKALLAERQGDLAEASSVWTAYALLARASASDSSGGQLHEVQVATAGERKKAIAAALERQTASAQVRQRIEKNLADAASRK